jgi:hypothetical protein
LDQRIPASVDHVLREHLSEVGCKHPDQGATIKYGDVAVRAGVGAARAVPPYLKRIAEQCKQRHEPSFDCLVINKTTRKPGGKWLNADAWNREIQRCVDWAKGLVQSSIDVDSPHGIPL